MISSKVSTPEAQDVVHKTVFLRVDLDVPVKDDKVIDDFRLKNSLPTIRFLLANSAQIIVAGHRGRPNGIDPSLSLEPIAHWLSQQITNQKLNLRNIKIGEFMGWEVAPRIHLLENLRFFKQEEENDPAFAKKLAALAQVYINDAFADSHRQHASIVGVPRLLPHFAGFHFAREVDILSKIMNKPQRPLVVIIGGAKIETKLPLVEKMHRIADYVLVGGKIAQETRKLLVVQHEKISGHKGVLLVADLNEDSTDITPNSIENFLQIIGQAKSIIWNGPMGKTPDCEEGTREIAEGIVESGANTVVGGGDTITFLQQEGLLEKLGFVSAGGGAMLSLLSGEALPGLEALS